MYITKKKGGLKWKVLFSIVVILAVLFTLLNYIENRIAPTLQALGDMRAQEVINRAVHLGVKEIIEQEIFYQDLISLKTDHEGNITVMQANSLFMNRIATEAALAIQEKLEAIKDTVQGIPLGSALGSQLLAQKGPKLKLTLTPIGKVHVNFGSEFDQAGINQTRHRIFLTVTTEVQVIVPFSSQMVKSTIYVPLAETIIVGPVPQSYFQVPSEKTLHITPVIEN